MNFSQLEKDFYEEVCSNLKDFPAYEINRIRNTQAPESGNVNYNNAVKKIKKLNLSDDELSALETIIRHALTGTLHSTFVTIDGGTALSTNGKALELVDAKTGVPITEGALHENFMFNLPDDLV